MPTAVRSGAFLCFLLHGCATIPKQSYGVRALDLEGVQQMDEEAVKVCLVTQARERTGLTLGPAGEPECGVPPFDASRLPIALWSWPFTSWPVYDEAVFDRDLSRIVRWYKARGFYDARVRSVTRKRDDQDRTIALSVQISEGEPTRVAKVELHGIDDLDRRLHRRVQRAVELSVGDRFDEALYDASKRSIVEVLREASYAQAKVEGHVLIDPPKHRANITFEVTLGRRYRFGHVSIEGQGNLPTRPILGAAALDYGAPFSVTALEDAKRAIYELGPFAAVELREHPHPETGLVDIDIKVVSGRRLRTAVGLGMQVGADPTLVPSDVGDSLVLWDVHLLGKIQYRNFLGGMRSISIEDRPRLIFDRTFPRTPAPDLGNLLIVDFHQPGFIEARTSLVASARWDRGPDPYGNRFLRSDMLASTGVERSFLGGKLALSATINTNLFLPDGKTAADTGYPDYVATYMQYRALLDLRDDPREPRRGAYFGLTIQHAGYFLPSNWNYVRVTPDARGYVPLPLGMVLAGRLRLGWMEITSSSIQGDTDPFGYVQRLRDFGPLRQRLRGGGNNSVRGYAPNTLGDVTAIGTRIDSGGLRQWEASLELRAPLTASFGAVLFVDVGDVSRTKAFRLRYPQTSFGFGLRYKTLIGPVRLDVGFAPPLLQTIGPDDRARIAYTSDGGMTSFPESRAFGLQGAIHFTIGEAF